MLYVVFDHAKEFVWFDQGNHSFRAVYSWIQLKEQMDWKEVLSRGFPWLLNLERGEDPEKG